MAPYSALFTRDDASSSTDPKSLSVLSIVGFGVAGALLTLIVVWLIVMFWRRRLKKKREDERGAAFLTVRGIVKDPSWSGGPLPADLLNIRAGEGFSRANLTMSIIMPDKAIVHSNTTREEIIAHHVAEGTLPRPFAPFSFAMQASAAASAPTSPQDSIAHSKAGATIGSFDDRSSRCSTLTVHGPGDSAASPTATHPHTSRPFSTQRSSILSALRDSVHSSFFGGSTARLSVASSTASSLRTGAMQVRRVRQVFTPILPDEPLLAPGERVTVMQAFDDGWCVVARQAPYARPGAGDVELGAVPAWCFVKPMKGLRSERPVRSSSLGVTVQMDMDVPEKRDDIISWSNF